MEKSPVNGDVQDLIKLLLTQITEAARTAPGEKATELAESAETLTKEVTREKPRREWYEPSLNGIKDAAQAVGEVGKPILETVATPLPVLAAIWP